MKFEKQTTIEELSLNNDLNLVLEIYRKQRSFNPEKYIKDKLLLLKKYLNRYDITNLIIPLSGGIDSSVVLALVNELRKDMDIQITGFNTSVLSSSSVTNQEDTILLSKELCEHFKTDYISVDISKIVLSIVKTFSTHIEYNSEQKLTGYFQNLKQDKISGTEDYKWSEGQLIPCLRTALNYYVSSIYQDMNLKTLIVGTTNRDEMSYIGFFGKASDLMVDIQLITDLHKSEVFKLAKHLKVPDSIINRKPNGDMYHNKSDEDFFGFSYDFLELFTYLKELDVNEKHKLFKMFNYDTKDLYDKFLSNVYELHHKNEYKYPLKSQAIHFDLTPIEFKQYSENIPKHEMDKLKGLAPSNQEIETLENITWFHYKNDLKVTNIKPFEYLHKPDLIKIQNMLTESEVRILTEFFNQGNEHSYYYTDKDGSLSTEKSFSKRKSVYSEHLSKTIFERLSPHLDKILKLKNTDLEFDELTSESLWTPISISPYFRFIEYKKNGELIPHYDTPHKYDSETFTLKTLILSLTTNKEGATEFYFEDCKDYRDHKDLIYKDPIAKYEHESGSMLMFDHRVLHQVRPVKKDETKLIIRTDLIYKKINIK